ncbi:type I restriction endonuclease subunit R [Roseicella aquatilis]|uniref:Type I restriction enzyme endonuclease subunit n=1 Tax=Roseicella aquatilis TaxID=2527868 RepID=A0A4R4D4I0_9PROT|nr:type I restriction endonuclease subunit R [Roseicella aquatilis]TCZ54584.1 type I restriction endonuclease subunit R [Roseicella aquatilis]
MTAARRPEELTEVELPAAEALELVHGWRPLTAAEADLLRDGLAEPILTRRLEEALRRLNPWLDEDGLRRAVAAVSRVAGADLLEVNEKVHTALTYGVTAAAEAGGRRRSRTVRFFDFDGPGGNTFELVRQFRVRGPRQDVVIDLVGFVNGVPLAVLEAKAPSLPDPLGDGIERFRRYQGLGPYAGLGAPRLFEVAQVSIVIAKDAAAYATTATPARHWGNWRTPYPMREQELEERLGRRPTAQDILLCSLMSPAVLLDLVRSFVAFETEDGRRIKKVARYQQVIAVDLAIRRILAAPDPALRGGVIHHTQGSGKSLTMVFLATKLRRLPEAENPTIVIVTDRTELDRQITGVFRNAGFANPMQAESGEQLRSLLATGAGQTVLTTVHKFHTAVPPGAPPITLARNVFVLVDEAHRTQYGGLAARMRRGLPGACMLAFTGTPIDRQDRSTRRVFGDYIHRYQIADAVRDGATVPIFYEMRDARLRIDGPDLERRLREENPELSDADIARLRGQVGGLSEAIAGAPARVEAVARDILNHYRQVIEPNGFKAQVVAVNRRTAVAYKEAFDRLGGPESVVVMSGGNDDDADLRAHHTTARERESLTERFKDRADLLRILVVCDMLLTGFDAPVEQVMYLDAPLREHLLLQAIARTNRVAEGKTHGLVVDYWGDAARIGEALSMFDEEDVRPALKPREEMVVLMHNRHRAAIRFFDGVDLADDEACLGLLEAEDVRAAFDIAFRRFAEAMEMVLPDPRAIEEPYYSDLRRLAGLRARARRRFRDERLNVRPYAEKVRALIDEALEAEGPRQLLEPVSILSPEFRAQIEALGGDPARAAEMEHAIRHEIHQLRDQNPAAYGSLAQRLEEIVNERREARVGAAAALRELDGLAEEVRAQHRRDRAAGDDGLAGAVAALLVEGVDGAAPAVGREIAAALEGLAIVDWHGKEDVQRQMRRAIKAALRGGGAPAERIEALTARVMDVARARLRA